MEIVLRMFFLSLSNIDVKFGTKKLTWKRNTVVVIIPMVKQVKLINKYEFVKAALDKDSKTYIVYIATLKNTELHSSRVLLLAIL